MGNRRKSGNNDNRWKQVKYFQDAVILCKSFSPGCSIINAKNMIRFVWNCHPLYHLHKVPWNNSEIKVLLKFETFISFFYRLDCTSLFVYIWFSLLWRLLLFYIQFLTLVKLLEGILYPKLGAHINIQRFPQQLSSDRTGQWLRYVASQFSFVSACTNKAGNYPLHVHELTKDETNPTVRNANSDPLSNIFRRFFLLLFYHVLSLTYQPTLNPGG